MTADYGTPMMTVTSPAGATNYYPHYWSTYCIHGAHDDCRLTCKTCKAPCLCHCHAHRAGSPEAASHQSARLKVLKILADRGEFRDNDGRAVSLLKELTGHRTTNGLSNLLQRLEGDGLIKRWTAGRRTYSISITPAGKQAAQDG